MHKPHLPAFALSLAFVVVASPALAEGGADTAAAAALITEGWKLVEQGRIGAGCDKMEAAIKLRTSPGKLLSAADCREKNGQTATSYGLFLEAGVLSRKEGDADREKEAQRRVDLLKPKLSKLTIEVAAGAAGPGLVITRDGNEVPEALWSSAIPVDPGLHTVEARRPGKLPFKTTITIEKPGATSVPVPPLADAPPEAVPAPADFWSPQRIAAVSVGAAGGVGLVVGGILGGVALHKTSALKSGGQCSPDLSVCTVPGRSAWESAQGIAHGSTASLVIGGAALATGVVVFATAGSSGVASGSGSRVVVGPVAGAGLTGVLLRGGW